MYPATLGYPGPYYPTLVYPGYPGPDYPPWCTLSCVSACSWAREARGKPGILVILSCEARGKSGILVIPASGSLAGSLESWLFLLREARGSLESWLFLLQEACETPAGSPAG